MTRAVLPTSSKQRNPSDYFYFSTYSPRWSDNDVNLHLNNSVYGILFDTITGIYFVEYQDESTMVATFLVDSHWHFFAPAAFPDMLDVGLRINKLGKSSLQFEVAVFIHGHESPTAVGYRTQVCIDMESQKSIGGPKRMREGLQKLYRPLDMPPASKL
ncbi:hypothetical protein AN958_01887 [Leucoagaricus sp. SymC.cos]|nr:hypothetical protein AN958_01887 [Leucoagaricus sp. SymC.cos]